MQVKNLVLGIGIFVVYLLAVGYGIETFYPSPQYEQFCKVSDSGRYLKPLGFGNCTFSQALQEQADKCYVNDGVPLYQYDDAGCTTAVNGCNYCNKEYRIAYQTHQKIVFLIALIAGIITLLIGYSILFVEPVGSALIASGIGAIFYGSAWNWVNLTNVWRFLLLVIALILLIWITLRVNSKSLNKKRL